MKIRQTRDKTFIVIVAEHGRHEMLTLFRDSEEIVIGSTKEFKPNRSRTYVVIHPEDMVSKDAEIQARVMLAQPRYIEDSIEES